MLELRSQKEKIEFVKKIEKVVNEVGGNLREGGIMEVERGCFRNGVSNFVKCNRVRKVIVYLVLIRLMVIVVKAGLVL